MSNRKRTKGRTIQSIELKEPREVYDKKLKRNVVQPKGTIVFIRHMPTVKTYARQSAVNS